MIDLGKYLSNAIFSNIYSVAPYIDATANLSPGFSYGSRPALLLSSSYCFRPPPALDKANDPKPIVPKAPANGCAPGIIDVTTAPAVGSTDGTNCPIH